MLGRTKRNRRGGGGAVGVAGWAGSGGGRMGGWGRRGGGAARKRCRRSALPPHSKFCEPWFQVESLRRFESGAVGVAGWAGSG